MKYYEMIMVESYEDSNKTFQAAYEKTFYDADHYELLKNKKSGKYTVNVNGKEINRMPCHIKYDKDYKYDDQLQKYVLKNTITESSNQPKSPEIVEIPPETVPEEDSELPTPKVKKYADGINKKTYKRSSWKAFDTQHGAGALASMNAIKDEDYDKLIDFIKKDPALPLSKDKLAPEHQQVVSMFEKKLAFKSELPTTYESTATNQQNPEKKSTIVFHASVHGKARACHRVASYDKDDWKGLLDEVTQHFADHRKLLPNQGDYVFHSTSRNVALSLAGDHSIGGKSHMTIKTIFTPNLPVKDDEKVKKVVIESFKEFVERCLT